MENESGKKHDIKKLLALYIFISVISRLCIAPNYCWGFFISTDKQTIRPSLFACQSIFNKV